MALIDLANPTRFLNLAHRALPWLAEITAAVFVLGLYLAYGAPDDDGCAGRHRGRSCSRTCRRPGSGALFGYW